LTDNNFGPYDILCISVIYDLYFVSNNSVRDFTYLQLAAQFCSVFQCTQGHLCWMVEKTSLLETCTLCHNGQYSMLLHLKIL